MKLLISLLLSLLIYFSLLFFFFYFLFFNTNKTNVVEKKVYIHKAIIKAPEKHNSNIEKKVIINENKKIKKTKEKKSLSTFSHSGKDISFEDIFSNTSANIPTKKIEYKKTENMTIKKGNEITKLVKKELSKLESTINISSSNDIETKNYISNEFERVWAETNTKDGDFVELSVIIDNNKLRVIVISTNLDTITLNNFLQRLQSIDIKKIKYFNGVIKFNTKLKGK